MGGREMYEDIQENVRNWECSKSSTRQDKHGSKQGGEKRESCCRFMNLIMMRLVWKWEDSFCRFFALFGYLFFHVSNHRCLIFFRLSCNLLFLDRKRWQSQCFLAHNFLFHQPSYTGLAPVPNCSVVDRERWGTGSKKLSVWVSGMLPTFYDWDEKKKKQKPQNGKGRYCYSPLSFSF